MKPEDGVTGAVYAEQVATVFRQMPIALAVNLVNAALTALVLAPMASRKEALLFFAAVAAVTAARSLLWLRYRRAAERCDTAAAASRIATAGALLTGLCWGIGAAILFPAAPAIGKVFLTIVIGGMCAGAVVINAAHLPTLLVFVLSASLPVAARLLVDGAATSMALAAMIGIFALALSVAGRHLNRTFTEAMRLRFELHDANLRLQAEIAEHRATEDALRQAQKVEAIGQLTGGIAHDFNNLMTVVMGNLVLATRHVGEASPAAPLLQAALQATERGVVLIQRLLAFARKQSLDPRPTDLGALVSGIEELLRRTLGPEIALAISRAPPSPPAYVDPNQLELAILNLAINARDAMPKGGTVRIAVAERGADRAAPPELAPGRYVVLSIADDGVGMDAETLSRAFEPFFTTKRVGTGSGLGLPMVRGFAAQSGGAVAIHSRPGSGSTVELWLPATMQSPAAATRDRSGPPIARGSARLLLCDDDDEVRRFLAEFLRSIGHTVYEASGGDAALSILKQDAPIDLFISDYAMPGMNGLETIRRARSQVPRLRPLLITGYAGSLDEAAAGVPVLRKPFTPAKLADRIQEILAA